MKVLDAAGRFVPVATAGAEFIEGGPPSSGGVIAMLGGLDGEQRHRTYRQVYRSNPYLFACVQLYGRSVARFPLKVYSDGDVTERVRRSDGGRAASLAQALRRPGFGRSQQTLWHSTMVDRLVAGNAVWFPERDRSGDYLGFRRVPWKYVGTETTAGLLRYWDTRRPTVKRLADDVVHFGAGLDCDDLFNPSPIGALHTTLALHDAVAQHLVAYFGNSARPSGHLQVDRATGKTARDRMREELTKLYSGPANAGRVMVTSGEWTSITETPANTQVVELAKQSREEICSALACPPPMIGILDRAIMSNVRELRSYLARDIVGAHTMLLEGDIDAQVLARDPELDNNYVEFEMGAALRPDLETRAKTWKDQRYVRSLNEIRRTEGLPPVDHPDADVPWIPLNEGPIGDPGARPRTDEEES